MAYTSPRAVAVRYAKAFLSVAVEQADPGAAGDELAGFAALLGREPELRRALELPAITLGRKQHVLAAVARSARVSPLTTRLLRVLLEHDRLRFIAEIADAYREQLDEHLRIARVSVTSAIQLGDAQVAALERRLADLTGRRVVIEQRVDPAIVGGLVARMGTQVFDGSVIGQLRRMKERLGES